MIRAPEGSIHIHASSASHCFCVWHIGSPCCLGWHCVTLLCVCERECEKKSRGKNRKEASVPSGTHMGLVFELRYSTHMNAGWNLGYLTFKKLEGEHFSGTKKAINIVDFLRQLYALLSHPPKKHNMV